MGTLNTDNAWRRFGKKNPYYGVLTDDKYLDENITEQNLDEFFFTGTKYVDNLFRKIHNKIDKDFKPNTVLDFGCGTGRLVIPFAKRSESVVGLDVSKDMLAIAQSNAKKHNLNNIRFCISDDKLSEISDQKFDLINSFIVFQHINVKRGEKLIQLLLNKLNDNGICALQLTYHIELPRRTRIINFFRIRIPYLHNFLNVLDKSPVNTPLIQVNPYNLNIVFYILQMEGIRNCFVHYTNHGGALGVQLIFRKKSNTQEQQI